MATDLREVLRSRSFWMMGLAVALIGFVDQGLTQHTVLYLDKDLGLGRSLAAQALSLIFLLSIAGKVGFGWVMDKLSVKGVMLCYLLMALAIILAFSARGTVILILFCLVREVAHGGAIVDVPILCKHAFGPRVLGRTIGLLTTFLTTGFAAGPLALGYLHDHQDTYHYGFLLLIGCSMAATLALLGVEPAYWKSLRRTETDTSATAASKTKY